MSLAICALMAVAGIVMLAMYVALRPHEPVTIWSAIGLSVGGVFGVWTYRTTRYELYADTLAARAGPFRRAVVLGNIESVVPTRSIESALATSIDRLAIRHGGSRYPLLVSPRDRDAFLEALVAACPQLSRRGDSLVSS